MTDPRPAPARSPVWPFPPRLLDYPVAPPIPKRAPSPRFNPAGAEPAPY